MKEPKATRHDTRASALHALKVAIVEGATWRYEELLAVAVRAGATDEDIDTVAHQAFQALLLGAEQPLTPRRLAQGWPTGQIRS